MTPTNETKDERTMLATPIAQLLRSRKAVAALVGILLNIFIALAPLDIAPRLEAMRGDLILAITILASLLVGGIAVEDAAANAQTPPGGTTLEESRKVTTVAPTNTPVPTTLPKDPTRG